MILGRDIHPAAACFDELEDAVTALTKQPIALNAHAFPRDIPKGAIVYNLENIPAQLQTDAFEGHEIWDFSARNVAAWRAAGRKATHVPVGYHPSMTRFEMRPWEERDIDVVFCGCLNDRRVAVLQALRERGLNVVVIGPGEQYGAERDAILARSKLALNMLYDESGTFPVLRSAHAAANGLPMLSETAPEIPDWVYAACKYHELVGSAVAFLADRAGLQHVAAVNSTEFRYHAMKLPATSPMLDPRWAMLRDTPPETWDLAAMYDAARGAKPHDGKMVALVVPSYRETERVAQVCRASRNAVRVDLEQHGIPSAVWPIVGDSLICRMRQRACHAFLMSPASHMLFCDADIECITPECVRGMLESGHDVVAGACPFKAPGGRTVANLWPEDEGKPPVVNGCVEVQDAGTGWMLVSREALYALMTAHPELLHWSMSDQDRGAPLWALFDTGVINGVYQSEDFMFCHLWQEHGGKVYVHAPGRFRHWGEHGYEGSFVEQYALITEVGA